MRYFGQCVCCKERFVIQDMPGADNGKYFQVDWSKVEVPHTCARSERTAKLYVKDRYSFLTIFFKWEPLKGSHNPEKKCDSRCQSAKRGSCDCSCGGHNHGICA